MALVVYYTNYKEFNMYSEDINTPEVKTFIDWSEYWNILGYWNTIPTFKELLKAKKKEKNI